MPFKVLVIHNYYQKPGGDRMLAKAKIPVIH